VLRLVYPPLHDSPPPAAEPAVEPAIERIARSLAEIQKTLASFPRLGNSGGMDGHPAVSSPAGGGGVHAPGVPAPADPLMDAYAVERSGEVTKQHVKELRTLVLDLLEHAGIDDLTAVRRVHIVEFLHWCETAGRPHRINGKPTKRRVKAGAKTRRNHLSMLRKFFAWCIEAREIRMENPCLSVKSPRVRHRQFRAFSPGEAAAIMSVAPPARALFYRVLWVGGPRAGAIGGSKEKPPLPDWCFETGATPPRVLIPAEFSKTGNEYVCALDNATAAAIDLHRLTLPDHAASLPLFKRPTRKQFFRDCRRAGVQLKDARGRGVGLHCFRRGMVTTTLDMGFDIKVAQMQAGHASVATTVLYADRDIRNQGCAAESLAQSLVSGISRGIPDRPGAPVSPRNRDKVNENSAHAVDDGRGICEGEGVTRPMPTTTNPTRSSDPRRAAPAGRVTTSQRGVRPGSGDRSSDRMGSDGMSKWAIQDSNRYPPHPDVPPRAAAILERFLDIADRLIPTRPDPSEESDREHRSNRPSSPARRGE
jgi:integrase